MTTAATTTEAPQTTGTPTPAAQTAVIPAPKREVRVVEDDSQQSYLMDTARFEHTCRIAGMMARAGLLPKHLKGLDFEQTQANCFLVVNQALRWQLDPFAVAPETYEVGGKLGFQGKLIAAVVNARARLAERLSYSFNDAKGDALEVTVSGRLEGEETPRTVTVTVGQARTENKMWNKDPQQKLIYTGAIKWARRHVPEIVLGVLSDDDLEAMREEARLQNAKPAKTPDFGAPKILERTTAPAKDPTPAQVAETAPEPEKDPVASAESEPKPSEPAPTDPVPTSDTPFKANPQETEACSNIRFLMNRDKVTENQVLGYCKAQSIGDKAKITELSDAKLVSLGKAWNNVLPQIRSYPTTK